MTKERQKEHEQSLEKVRRLAEQQGVRPVSNIDELRSDFWPADESADNFLAWLHCVRQEESSGSRPE